MASLLKASTDIVSAKGKRKADVEDGEVIKKVRKDKVLLLCSRGVTQRMRHLMRDLEVLLPHTKKGKPFSTHPPALESPRPEVFGHIFVRFAC